MSLDRVRADIDAIDERLVGLLAERESLVREAATYKTSERSVRAPDRVEQVLAKVRASAERHDASEAVVVAVYRAMIGAFIELELTERAGLEPTDGGADGPQPAGSTGSS